MRVYQKIGKVVRLEISYRSDLVATKGECVPPFARLKSFRKRL